jgi:hypothetical protein
MGIDFWKYPIEFIIGSKIDYWLFWNKYITDIDINIRVVWS